MWSGPVPALLAGSPHAVTPCRHQQQRGASRANSVSNMPFTQSGSQFTEAGGPETLGDFSQDNFSLGGGNFDFKSQVRCCSLLFMLDHGLHVLACCLTCSMQALPHKTPENFSRLKRMHKMVQCCCAGH